MNQFSKLSRGCQLCQQGKWLCIFLTYECNADCHFCPAPVKRDEIHSAFGSRKEDILPYLAENDFEGISFSGGEPFISYERLKEWLIYFKKHLPDFYYWVYTNGLLVNKERLYELSELGMEEIRFNIAATGYLSDVVLKNIEIARECFPYVSVEVPSIKKDYPVLKRSLEKLAGIGIDFLNLHDYILTENDQEAKLDKAENFVLNRSIPVRRATSSRQNTTDLINYCSSEGYSFHINHCSLEQKEVQMLQRRIRTGKIFSDADCDYFSEEGLVLNFYTLPERLIATDLYSIFSDPKKRETLKNFQITKFNYKNITATGNNFLMVSYIPGMEINQEKILMDIHSISHEDFVNMNFVIMQ
jgi:uncharacterized protein